MDSYLFEELSNAQPLEITDTLQAQVQLAAKDSFPDDEGVVFRVTRAVVADMNCFVEVTPDADTGYDKYVFELNADYSVRRCRSLEDGAYTPLFD